MFGSPILKETKNDDDCDKNDDKDDDDDDNNFKNYMFILDLPLASH